MTFAHHKSLLGRFWCITINESGLARIAKIVKEATLEFEEALEIKLISSDGEDIYRSNEPDSFFDKSSVPQVISEVTISYHHYEAPLSCKVRLLAGAKGRAELLVDGNDAKDASGLFRELSREIESHAGVNVWWVKRMDNLYFELFLSLVAAVAVFCAFDFGLFLADAALTKFNGSTLHSVIFTVGWVCVLFSFIFGGSRIGTLLKAYFPAVQFNGHFADPEAPTRARLFWVTSALVLPILLNVVTSMVGNLLEWFSPE